MIAIEPQQARTASGKVMTFGRAVIRYRGRTVGFARDNVYGSNVAFIVKRSELSEAVIAEIEKRMWEHDKQNGFQPEFGYERRMMFLPED